MLDNLVSKMFCDKKIWMTNILWWEKYCDEKHLWSNKFVGDKICDDTIVWWHKIMRGKQIMKKPKLCHTVLHLYRQAKNLLWEHIGLYWIYLKVKGMILSRNLHMFQEILEPKAENKKFS